MNFSQAIGVQKTKTTNGMDAFVSTSNKCVDLFASIGASRGKDVVPAFVGALTENTDYAMRIAQWARDVRGGSGERKVFRDILTYLVKNQEVKALALLDKVSLLGRWDDLWSVFGLNEKVDRKILDIVVDEFSKGNGLLAKWLPRQSEVINGKDFTKALRERLHLSPKDYRKAVVANTNVVEQFMCSKNWNEINFSHVPSLAHSRYKKAFYKNAEAYKAYVEALVKGTDPKVKINAGAVYPYDVIKGLNAYGISYNETEKAVIDAQWNALPDFLEDNSILAVVDVSGSMTCPAGGFTSKSETTCMDVAVSLGLYVADKLKGDFKDCFLTFSSEPELLKLKGTVTQKVEQMIRSKWAMSTDLQKAMELVLKTAVNGNVSQEDMPKTLLIMSDMQFNCAGYNQTAFEMINKKFNDAGYVAPQVVFWNINDHGNKPATFDQKGVALVSGFSPSILRSILSAKTFTPEAVMLETILNERYDLNY